MTRIGALLSRGSSSEPAARGERCVAGESKEARPALANPGRWVAIVDDDPSVRSALARVLRTAGIRVETYATAHEYLSASMEREPVCLVLDVHLGGMTGFDLQDRLIASGSRVRVVFITAHDEVPSDELERRAGPDGYLRKPFDGDQLLALVRRVAHISTPR